MSYEFNKQDAFDLAATLGIQTNVRGNELDFLTCPYCGGGARGKDKKSFSINLDTGEFHCLRSTCSKSGRFTTLARDFDFQLDFGEPKEYKRIPQVKVVTRPAAVTYLESRGISAATAEKYHITTMKKNQDVLVFPFYDQDGVIQFVKYRNTKFNGKGNKEWAEKDAKPILFGMDNCTPGGTLVITEGQIDSLSVAEAGIQNVVSVPNGARGFTWFRHCEEWISQFDDIVVFGDNERGHITLVDDLQARLTQKIRVVRVQDYMGEKDANDILRKYGAEDVRFAVEHAQVPKLKNIKDLSEVKAVDLESLPKIRTGITPLDRTLGGLYFGQVSLISGKRGDGKSTLASQIMAEALNQDICVFAYSGELPDFHFKRWLDLQLAGKGNLTENENEFHEKYYTIPSDVQDKINGWYKGRAFIYDNAYVPEKDIEKESLLQTIEKVIRQYDAKLIFVDNLMTAMDQVNDKSDLYNAQGNFVWALKRLAMTYNVHIMLVAHPKKTKEGEMGNDEVSGSSDITNKVDTVIFYNRTDDGGSRITVTKNRLNGKLATGQNAIIVNYSASCKRITSVQDSSNKAYGWEEKEVPEGFEALQDDAECPF